MSLDRLVEPLDMISKYDILLNSKEETFDKIERIVGEMHMIGYMKSFERIVERLRKMGTR